MDQLLENLARQTDEKVASRSRSQLGFMLTCLNQADEAVQTLKECAHAQQSLRDFRGLVATELRLVEAFQASDQVAPATETAQAALARCSADQALL